jgi:hypothetical protein
MVCYCQEQQQRAPFVFGFVPYSAHDLDAHLFSSLGGASKSILYDAGDHLPGISQPRSDSDIPGWGDDQDLAQGLHLDLVSFLRYQGS